MLPFGYQSATCRLHFSYQPQFLLLIVPSVYVWLAFYNGSAATLTRTTCLSKRTLLGMAAERLAAERLVAEVTSLHCYFLYFLNRHSLYCPSRNAHRAAPSSKIQNI